MGMASRPAARVAICSCPVVRGYRVSPPERSLVISHDTSKRVGKWEKLLDYLDLPCSPCAGRAEIGRAGVTSGAA